MQADAAAEAACRRQVAIRNQTRWLRTQIHLRAGKATVYTSSGLDWTDRFATIAQAAKAVPANQAVLDGEIVVQDERGVPDFHALRAAIGREPHRLLFYAFDLLHLDGFDLRGATLHDRRAVLVKLLAMVPPTRIVLMSRWRASSRRLRRKEQHAKRIGGGMRQGPMCSTTSSASPMHSVVTRRLDIEPYGV